MSNNTQNRGTPVFATASGVGTAAAFLSPLPGQTYHITDIHASSAVSGGGGTWALLAGATGTTILWTGAGNVTKDFATPIVVSMGGTVSLYINGTTLSYANISAYVL